MEAMVRRLRARAVSALPEIPKENFADSEKNPCQYLQKFASPPK